MNDLRLRLTTLTYAYCRRNRQADHSIRWIAMQTSQWRWGVCMYTIASTISATATIIANSNSEAFLGAHYQYEWEYNRNMILLSGKATFLIVQFPVANTCAENMHASCSFMIIQNANVLIWILIPVSSRKSLSRTLDQIVQSRLRIATVHPTLILPSLIRLTNAPLIHTYLKDSYLTSRGLFFSSSWFIYFFILFDFFFLPNRRGVESLAGYRKGECRGWWYGMGRHILEQLLLQKINNESYYSL